LTTWAVLLTELCGARHNRLGRRGATPAGTVGSRR